TKKGNAHGPKPGRTCAIGELPIMVVVKEVVGVIRKIGFHDVGPSIAIIVGCIKAHTGLFAAIRAVCNASRCADFGEPAFAVVVVQLAGSGIVSHIKIEATVLVIIKPQNAEAVVGVWIDVQFLGDVGKSSVTIVVIETIARAFQSTRSARHLDSAILTERSTANLGKMR